MLRKEGVGEECCVEWRSRRLGLRMRLKRVVVLTILCFDFTTTGCPVTVIPSHNNRSTAILSIRTTILHPPIVHTCLPHPYCPASPSRRPPSLGRRPSSAAPPPQIPSNDSQGQCPSTHPLIILVNDIPSL